MKLSGNYRGNNWSNLAWLLSTTINFAIKTNDGKYNKCNELSILMSMRLLKIDKILNVVN